MSLSLNSAYRNEGVLNRRRSFSVCRRPDTLGLLLDEDGRDYSLKSGGRRKKSMKIWARTVHLLPCPSTGTGRKSSGTGESTVAIWHEEDPQLSPSSRPWRPYRAHETTLGNSGCLPERAPEVTNPGKTNRGRTHVTPPERRPRLSFSYSFTYERVSERQVGVDWDSTSKGHRPSEVSEVHVLV